ncbi:MAG: hypothetical protein BGO69_10470 [Bacteroidetes bacterium 46-16]|nr:MAG: hypothetical protein BGO69_10470 [Bacteroidetes bacterium 46-16]
MNKIIPLLVIFFLSLYLLLVSIVATSHLDLQARAGESEFTEATLDTALGSAMPVINIPQYDLPESENRRRIPDYLKDIRTKISKDRTLKKYVNIFNANATQLSSLMDDQDIKLRPVYIALGNKKRHFDIYLGQLKANAHIKFSTLAKELSSKEKNGYYSQIVNAFNQTISSNTVYFNSAVTELENTSDQVKYFTNQKLYQLQSLSAYLSDSTTDVSDTAMFMIENITETGIKIPPVKDAPFEGDKSIKAIPDYDKNGYEWGWLGQISSWLIKPNSYDLILIVGMVGFGLFGAVISIFINKMQFDPNLSTFENTVNILIRGFAAAIVIFLATKGGIAILNTGSNKPNPYVLFTTCLVGAVFSQPVWDWAKDFIENAYKGKGKKE